MTKRRRRQSQPKGAGREVREDVIFQILSKLPVKSLLRFMCVSKEWYHLIKTPYFATTHFRYRNSHSNPSALLLKQNKNLLPSSSTGGNGCEFEISLLLEEEATASSFDLCFLNPLKMMTFCQFEIAGCSNGLVCIGLLLKLTNGLDRDDCRKLSVWNPATKQFIYLPKPPCWDLEKNLNMITGFGFIGDDIASDYKVVRILRNFSDGTVRLEAHVFSRSINCWRKVKHSFSYESIDFIVHDAEEDESISLKGVVYFWGICRRKHVLQLWSFNLCNEVFIKLPLPDRRLGGKLFSWKSSLALFVKLDEYTRFWDIMTLTDDEHEEDHDHHGGRRWIKQFSILLSIPKDVLRVCKDQFVLFYSWNLGEADHNDPNGNLWAYDLATKTLRDIGRRKRGIYYLSALNYVESLYPV